MSTPTDTGDDGLTPEERRVAGHGGIDASQEAGRQDYVGSGNNMGSQTPRNPNEPMADDVATIGDRTEPGDAGMRSSAHRPAGGIPEGADPAQSPMRGTSEEFPVDQGIRKTVDMAEPDRRHGTSDAGSSGAAAGTVPAPAVEATQTENPYPQETWERPVTGVHRPAAPEGEVAPE